MASLLDQLYFSQNPWGEGGQNGGLLGNLGGMFNPQPMGQPQQFAGSFLPQQQMLPQNAAPTAAPNPGPPMNIMPPAQLNAMQPPQPGIMDRIGEAISANPTLLMALGAGTFQGGLGKGLEMGARYSVLDKQNQEQAFKNNLTRQQMASTLQFMRSRGVSDQDAALLLAQPKALEAWLAQNQPVDTPPALYTHKLGNNQEITLQRDARGNISQPVVPGLQQPPAKFDDAANLRKEYTALPPVKTYMEALPIYQSMFETAGRNSRASDLNLVYGLAKIFDPTSVVREGEMVAVKNTASLPDWLQGTINSLNGGAGLTPETRQRVLAEAKTRMDAYAGAVQPHNDRYTTIAQRYNIPVEDVVPKITPIQEWKPQPPATGPNQQNAPRVLRQIR